MDDMTLKDYMKRVEEASRARISKVPQTVPTKRASRKVAPKAHKKMDDGLYPSDEFQEVLDAIKNGTRVDVTGMSREEIICRFFTRKERYCFNHLASL